MIRRLVFVCAAVVLSTAPSALSANVDATTAPATPKIAEFSDFAGLRAELLSMIGAASRRVFVCTDFLTDADIVSSLYIAQYRKVNIKVLLGRDKASHMLSRLSYLQQVSIQTSLRPKDFYPASSTLLLIDDRLVTISINLDYLTRSKGLTITTQPIEDVAAFDTAFQLAMSGQAAPTQKPLPKVGRPRLDSKALRPLEANGTPISTGEKSVKAPERPVTGDSPDKTPKNPAPQAAYRYKAVKDKPQNGIPTKLPKTTISQERERQRQRALSNGADSEASTDSP
jgi:hypothetical protein